MCPKQVHSKSNGSDFEALDLVSALWAAGDPLHLMAAPTLIDWCATAERLQERIYQLEAIARINGATIRGMQQAAAQIERARWARP